MTFVKGNPIPDKAVLASEEAAADDALAARARGGGGNNPISGIMGMGSELMKVAEVFGVDKKEIGRMLVKSALTGKFELPRMKTESTKRKKLEVAVDQAIKLAWTFFGIFMIFQVFIVVVGVIT